MWKYVQFPLIAFLLIGIAGCPSDTPQGDDESSVGRTLRDGKHRAGTRTFARDSQDLSQSDAVDSPPSGGSEVELPPPNRTSTPPVRTTPPPDRTSRPHTRTTPPPSTSSPPSRSTPSRASYPIRLSTGVALAQAGPEGTMMMFSIDYEFLEGGPLSRSSYLWVIEASNSQPVAGAVELQREGNLMTYNQQWRPANGPFRCFIADRSGLKLSNTIDMH